MRSEATTFASSILSAHSVPLTAVRDDFSAETFNFLDAHDQPYIVAAITHVRFRATFNRQTYNISNFDHEHAAPHTRDSTENMRCGIGCGCGWL